MISFYKMKSFTFLCVYMHIRYARIHLAGIRSRFHG